MTIEEYAKQQIKSRIRVHFNKGTWWIQVKSFYCWPLYLFQKIEPKKSFPILYKAFIGYEHMVPNESVANAILPIMCLENVKDYSLEKLPKKRRQIIRGLERVKIKRISDVNELINDGYKINVSAAPKQHWAGNHSSLLDFRKWKERINQAFSFPAIEFWGAYNDKNKLIAWLKAYQVENTMFISEEMSHADYLTLYPNDALLFTFINRCKEVKDLGRITFGLWCRKRSLNKFKESLGFKKVDFPIFRHINPFVQLLIPFTRYKYYLEYKGK